MSTSQDYSLPSSQPQHRSSAPLVMRPAHRREKHVNVGELERWGTGAAGAVLLGLGLAGRRGGWLAMLAGGGLLYRAITGHCHGYEALGIDSLGQSDEDVRGVQAQHGLRADFAITIQKSPEELYRFWRNIENLPRVMSHLESVESLGGKRSHWKAKGPMGVVLEWDAEVINERENRLIAWESVEGSQVHTAGSVHFTPTPHERGTTIRVEMKYDPPGGKSVAALARLFGQGLQQDVQEDLRRFKQQMEAGEVATNETQSSQQ